MLKAQLECRRINYRKAIRLLTQAHDAATGVYPAGSRSEAFSNGVYLQNLGCALFRMGRFAAAALHFSKALGAVESFKDMESTAVLAGASGVSSKLTGDANLGYSLAVGLPSPYHTVRLLGSAVLPLRPCAPFASGGGWLSLCRCL